MKIPRYSPAILKQMAGPRGGDLEKVPTTPIRELVINGVSIDSRYQKADELEIMCGMILSLPGTMPDGIKQIWCDSKANNCYTVSLRKWDQMTAEQCATLIHDYAMEHPPYGHNGIEVQGPDNWKAPTHVWLDPDWAVPTLPGHTAGFCQRWTH